MHADNEKSSESKKDYTKAPKKTRDTKLKANDNHQTPLQDSSQGSLQSPEDHNKNQEREMKPSKNATIPAESTKNNSHVSPYESIVNISHSPHKSAKSLESSRKSSESVDGPKTLPEAPSLKRTYKGIDDPMTRLDSALDVKSSLDNKKAQRKRYESDEDLQIPSESKSSMDDLKCVESAADLKTLEETPPDHVMHFQATKNHESIKKPLDNKTDGKPLSLQGTIKSLPLEHAVGQKVCHDGTEKNPRRKKHSQKATDRDNYSYTRKDSKTSTESIENSTKAQECIRDEWEPLELTNNQEKTPRHKDLPEMRMNQRFPHANEKQALPPLSTDDQFVLLEHASDLQCLEVLNECEESSKSNQDTKGSIGNSAANNVDALEQQKTSTENVDCKKTSESTQDLNILESDITHRTVSDSKLEQKQFHERKKHRRKSSKSAREQRKIAGDKKKPFDTQPVVLGVKSQTKFAQSGTQDKKHPTPFVLEPENGTQRQMNPIKSANKPTEPLVDTKLHDRPDDKDVSFDSGLHHKKTLEAPEDEINCPKILDHMRDKLIGSKDSINFSESPLDQNQATGSAGDQGKSCNTGIDEKTTAMDRQQVDVVNEDSSIHVKKESNEIDADKCFQKQSATAEMVEDQTACRESADCTKVQLESVCNQMANVTKNEESNILEKAFTSDGYLGQSFEPRMDHTMAVADIEGSKTYVEDTCKDSKITETSSNQMHPFESTIDQRKIVESVEDVKKNPQSTFEFRDTGRVQESIYQSTKQPGDTWEHKMFSTGNHIAALHFHPDQSRTVEEIADLASPQNQIKSTTIDRDPNKFTPSEIPLTSVQIMGPDGAFDEVNVINNAVERLDSRANTNETCPESTNVTAEWPHSKEHQVTMVIRKSTEAIENDTHQTMHIPEVHQTATDEGDDGSNMHHDSIYKQQPSIVNDHTAPSDSDINQKRSIEIIEDLSKHPDQTLPNTTDINPNKSTTSVTNQKTMLERNEDQSKLSESDHEKAIENAIQHKHHFEWEAIHKRSAEVMGETNEHPECFDVKVSQSHAEGDHKTTPIDDGNSKTLSESLSIQLKSDRSAPDQAQDQAQSDVSNARVEASMKLEESSGDQSIESNADKTNAIDQKHKDAIENSNKYADSVNDKQKSIEVPKTDFHLDQENMETTEAQVKSPENVQNKIIISKISGDRTHPDLLTVQQMEDQNVHPENTVDTMALFHAATDQKTMDTGIEASERHFEGQERNVQQSEIDTMTSHSAAIDLKATHAQIEVLEKYYEDQQTTSEQREDDHRVCSDMKNAAIDQETTFTGTEASEKDQESQGRCVEQTEIGSTILLDAAICQMTTDVGTKASEKHLEYQGMTLEQTGMISLSVAIDQKTNDATEISKIHFGEQRRAVEQSEDQKMCSENAIDVNVSLTATIDLKTTDTVTKASGKHLEEGRTVQQTEDQKLSSESAIDTKISNAAIEQMATDTGVEASKKHLEEGRTVEQTEDQKLSSESAINTKVSNTVIDQNTTDTGTEASEKHPEKGRTVEQTDVQKLSSESAIDTKISNAAIEQMATDTGVEASEKHLEEGRTVEQTEDQKLSSESAIDTKIPNAAATDQKMTDTGIKASEKHLEEGRTLNQAEDQKMGSEIANDMKIPNAEIDQKTTDTGIKASVEHLEEGKKSEQAEDQKLSSESAIDTKIPNAAVIDQKTTDTEIKASEKHLEEGRTVEQEEDQKMSSGSDIDVKVSNAAIDQKMTDTGIEASEKHLEEGRTVEQEEDQKMSSGSAIDTKIPNAAVDQKMTDTGVEASEKHLEERRTLEPAEGSESVTDTKISNVAIDQKTTDAVVEVEVSDKYYAVQERTPEQRVDDVMVGSKGTIDTEISLCAAIDLKKTDTGTEASQKHNVSQGGTVEQTEIETSISSNAVVGEMTTNTDTEASEMHLEDQGRTVQQTGTDSTILLNATVGHTTTYEGTEASEKYLGETIPHTEDQMMHSESTIDTKISLNAAIDQIKADTGTEASKNHLEGQGTIEQTEHNMKISRMDAIDQKTTDAVVEVEVSDTYADQGRTSEQWEKDQKVYSKSTIDTEISFLAAIDQKKSDTVAEACINHLGRTAEQAEEHKLCSESIIDTTTLHDTTFNQSITVAKTEAIEEHLESQRKNVEDLTICSESTVNTLNAAVDQMTADTGTEASEKHHESQGGTVGQTEIDMKTETWTEAIEKHLEYEGKTGEQAKMCSVSTVDSKILLNGQKTTGSGTEASEKHLGEQGRTVEQADQKMCSESTVDTTSFDAPIDQKTADAEIEVSDKYYEDQGRTPEQREEDQNVSSESTIDRITSSDTGIDQKASDTRIEALYKPHEDQESTAKQIEDQELCSASTINSMTSSHTGIDQKTTDGGIEASDKDIEDQVKTVKDQNKFSEDTINMKPSFYAAIDQMTTDNEIEVSYNHKESTVGQMKSEKMHSECTVDQVTTDERIAGSDNHPTDKERTVGQIEGQRICSVSIGDSKTSFYAQRTTEAVIEHSTNHTYGMCNNASIQNGLNHIGEKIEGQVLYPEKPDELTDKKNDQWIKDKTVLDSKIDQRSSAEIFNNEITHPGQTKSIETALEEKHQLEFEVNQKRSFEIIDERNKQSEVAEDPKTTLFDIGMDQNITNIEAEGFQDHPDGEAPSDSINIYNGKTEEQMEHLECAQEEYKGLIEIGEYQQEHQNESESVVDQMGTLQMMEDQHKQPQHAGGTRSQFNSTVDQEESIAKDDPTTSVECNTDQKFQPKQDLHPIKNIEGIENSVQNQEILTGYVMHQKASTAPIDVLDENVGDTQKTCNSDILHQVTSESIEEHDSTNQLDRKGYCAGNEDSVAQHRSSCELIKSNDDLTKQQEHLEDHKQTDNGIRGQINHSERTGDHINVVIDQKTAITEMDCFEHAMVQKAPNESSDNQAILLASIDQICTSNEIKSISEDSQHQSGLIEDQMKHTEICSVPQMTMERRDEQNKAVGNESALHDFTVDQSMTVLETGGSKVESGVLPTENTSDQIQPLEIVGSPRNFLPQCTRASGIENTGGSVDHNKKHLEHVSDQLKPSVPDGYQEKTNEHSVIRTRAHNLKTPKKRTGDKKIPPSDASEARTAERSKDPKCKFETPHQNEIPQNQSKQTEMPHVVKNQTEMIHALKNHTEMSQALENQSGIPQVLRNQCEIPQVLNNQSETSQVPKNQTEMPRDQRIVVGSAGDQTKPVDPEIMVSSKKRFGKRTEEQLRHPEKTGNKKKPFYCRVDRKTTVAQIGDSEHAPVQKTSKLNQKISDSIADQKNTAEVCQVPKKDSECPPFHRESIETADEQVKLLHPEPKMIGNGVKTMDLDTHSNSAPVEKASNGRPGDQVSPLEVEQSNAISMAENQQRYSKTIHEPNSIVVEDHQQKQLDCAVTTIGKNVGLDELKQHPEISDGLVISIDSTINQVRTVEILEDQAMNLEKVQEHMNLSQHDQSNAPDSGILIKQPLGHSVYPKCAQNQTESTKRTSGKKKLPLHRRRTVGGIPLQRIEHDPVERAEKQPTQLETVDNYKGIFKCTDGQKEISHSGTDQSKGSEEVQLKDQGKVTESSGNEIKSLKSRVRQKTTVNNIESAFNGGESSKHQSKSTVLEDGQINPLESSASQTRIIKGSKKHKKRVKSASDLRKTLESGVQVKPNDIMRPLKSELPVETVKQTVEQAICPGSAQDRGFTRSTCDLRKLHILHCAEQTSCKEAVDDSILNWAQNQNEKILDENSGDVQVHIEAQNAIEKMKPSEHVIDQTESCDIIGYQIIEKTPEPAKDQAEPSEIVRFQIKPSESMESQGNTLNSCTEQQEPFEEPVSQRTTEAVAEHVENVKYVATDEIATQLEGSSDCKTFSIKVDDQGQQSGLDIPHQVRTSDEKHPDCVSDSRRATENSGDQMQPLHSRIEQKITADMAGSLMKCIPNDQSEEARLIVSQTKSVVAVNQTRNSKKSRENRKLTKSAHDLKKPLQVQKTALQKTAEHEIHSECAVDQLKSIESISDKQNMHAIPQEGQTAGEINVLNKVQNPVVLQGTSDHLQTNVHGIDRTSVFMLTESVSEKIELSEPAQHQTEQVCSTDQQSDHPDNQMKSVQPAANKTTDFKSQKVYKKRAKSAGDVKKLSKSRAQTRAFEQTAIHSESTPDQNKLIERAGDHKEPDVLHPAVQRLGSEENAPDRAKNDTILPDVADEVYSHVNGIHETGPIENSCKEVTSLDFFRDPVKQIHDMPSADTAGEIRPPENISHHENELNNEYQETSAEVHDKSEETEHHPTHSKIRLAPYESDIPSTAKDQLTSFQYSGNHKELTSNQASMKNTKGRTSHRKKHTESDRRDGRDKLIENTCNQLKVSESLVDAADQTKPYGSIVQDKAPVPSKGQNAPCRDTAHQIKAEEWILNPEKMQNQTAHHETAPDFDGIKKRSYGQHQSLGSCIDQKITVEVTDEQVKGPQKQGQRNDNPTEAIHHGIEQQSSEENFVHVYLDTTHLDSEQNKMISSENEGGQTLAESTVVSKFENQAETQDQNKSVLDHKMQLEHEVCHTRTGKTRSSHKRRIKSAGDHTKLLHSRIQKRTNKQTLDHHSNHSENGQNQSDPDKTNCNDVECQPADQNLGNVRLERSVPNGDQDQSHPNENKEETICPVSSIKYSESGGGMEDKSSENTCDPMKPTVPGLELPMRDHKLSQTNTGDQKVTQIDLKGEQQSSIENKSEPLEKSAHATISMEGVLGCTTDPNIADNKRTRDQTTNPDCTPDFQSKSIESSNSQMAMLPSQLEQRSTVDMAEFLLKSLTSTQYRKQSSASDETKAIQHSDSQTEIFQEQKSTIDVVQFLLKSLNDTQYQKQSSHESVGEKTNSQTEIVQEQMSTTDVVQFLSKSLNSIQCQKQLSIESASEETKAIQSSGSQTEMLQEQTIVDVAQFLSKSLNRIECQKQPSLESTSEETEAIQISDSHTKMLQEQRSTVDVVQFLSKSLNSIQCQKQPSIESTNEEIKPIQSSGSQTKMLKEQISTVDVVQFLSKSLNSIQYQEQPSLESACEIEKAIQSSDSQTEMLQEQKSTADVVEFLLKSLNSIQYQKQSSLESPGDQIKSIKGSDSSQTDMLPKEKSTVDVVQFLMKSLTSTQYKKQPSRESLNDETKAIEPSEEQSTIDVVQFLSKGLNTTQCQQQPSYESASNETKAIQSSDSQTEILQEQRSTVDVVQFLSKSLYSNQYQKQSSLENASDEKKRIHQSSDSQTEMLQKQRSTVDVVQFLLKSLNSTQCQEYDSSGSPSDQTKARDQIDLDEDKSTVSTEKPLDDTCTIDQTKALDFTVVQLGPLEVTLNQIRAFKEIVDYEDHENVPLSVNKVNEILPIREIPTDSRHQTPINSIMIAEGITEEKAPETGPLEVTLSMIQTVESIDNQQKQQKLLDSAKFEEKATEENAVKHVDSAENEQKGKGSAAGEGSHLDSVAADRKRRYTAAGKGKHYVCNAAEEKHVVPEVDVGKQLNDEGNLGSTVKVEEQLLVDGKEERKQLNSVEKEEKYIDSAVTEQKQFDSAVIGQKQPDSAGSGQKQLDSTVSGPKQPDSAVSGQNQPDSAVGGQNQPDSAVNGQNQPDSAVSGQKQPDSAVSGQKQPDSAVSGQKQPVSAVSGQKQPDSAVSGQKQPDSAVNGQKQPDSAVSGQNQPDSAVGGQNQPDTAVSGQKQPDSTVSGQEQLDSAVGGQKQPDSAVRGQKQPDSTVSGQEQLDSAVGGQKQPDSAVSGQKQPDSTVSGQEQLDSAAGEGKDLHSATKEMKHPSAGADTQFARGLLPKSDIPSKLDQTYINRLMNPNLRSKAQDQSSNEQNNTDLAATNDDFYHSIELEKEHAETDEHHMATAVAENKNAVVENTHLESAEMKQKTLDSGPGILKHGDSVQKFLSSVPVENSTPVNAGMPLDFATGSGKHLDSSAVQRQQEASKQKRLGSAVEKGKPVARSVASIAKEGLDPELRQNEQTPLASAAKLGTGLGGERESYSPHRGGANKHVPQRNTKGEQERSVAKVSDQIKQEQKLPNRVGMPVESASPRSLPLQGSHKVHDSAGNTKKIYVGVDPNDVEDLWESVASTDAPTKPSPIKQQHITASKNPPEAKVKAYPLSEYKPQHYIEVQWSMLVWGVLIELSFMNKQGNATKKNPELAELQLDELDVVSVIGLCGCV